jgi:hypothetical protein
MAMLGALGVEKDPRERLEQDYAAAAFVVPGQQPRVVKPKAHGVPDWWVDDAEASQSFLKAMGVKL